MGLLEGPIDFLLVFASVEVVGERFADRPQITGRYGTARCSGSWVTRGRLLNFRVYANGGTYPYDPTPGTGYVEVEVNGAGGGGSSAGPTGTVEGYYAPGGGAWANGFGGDVNAPGNPARAVFISNRIGDPAPRQSGMMMAGAGGTG